VDRNVHETKDAQLRQDGDDGVAEGFKPVFAQLPGVRPFLGQVAPILSLRLGESLGKPSEQRAP
jgi:hypothetical protein